MLSFLEQLYQQIIIGRLNKDDRDAQQIAQDDVSDIKTIEQQFDEVRLGKFAFSETYLTDRHLLHYWTRSFSFMSQMLRDSGDSMFQPVLSYLKESLSLAAVLETAAIDAASAGLLKLEYRLVLAEKWDILDAISKEYYNHDQSPRTLSTW